jgi:zinc/manganese transport system ATP-binding protein
MSQTSPRPVLEFTQAAVKLGGRVIWDNVDVRIDQGEFVAILGPNGAGKSTLIKAALGLMSLSSGEVRVLGRAPGRARERIGYLPQRRSFDVSMRVRGVDVVRLGLDGHRLGIPLPAMFATASQRQATARVAEVIELVGATSYADRPIGELSGGEQQRLLIAQALAPKPQLLLLDEPLDSLDLTNQSLVAALIQQICRDQHVTVVMVAHDVNPILGYLDKVVYIARGGVVSGSPQEVITTPTLSRLYDTPIEVLKAANGRLVVVGEPEAPAAHGNRHAR